MKTLFLTSLLSISTLSFASVPASQVINEINREADICLEQDNTTIGMRICLAKQAEQLDVLLNKTYQELRSKLSGEAENRLVQSQRDWLKYRTSNCELEAANMIAGTAETIIIMDCDNQMTEDKILQLDGILNTPL